MSQSEDTSTHWYDTDKGREFADFVFVAAGLTEPEGVSLKTGTYSNEEIAKAFEVPMTFMNMMMGIRNMGSEAEKRAIISFAIDMM